MRDSTWDILAAAHRATESPSRGADRTPNHEPTAAILACSDARVPPTILFDQPAGNLFVVRIAGNSAAPSAVASLDYAVAELGVDLIVVLGHTDCGAVTAAVEGTCGGHLAPIVAPICEIARANPGMDPDRVAELNVATTMAALIDHDGPVGYAASAGTVDVRGAIHDLRTGQLQPVMLTDQCPIDRNPTNRSQTRPPMEAS